MLRTNSKSFKIFILLLGVIVALMITAGKASDLFDFSILSSFAFSEEALFSYNIQNHLANIREIFSL